VWLANAKTVIGCVNTEKGGFSLMKRKLTWLAAAASLIFSAQSGVAQPSQEPLDVRKEIDALKQGQSAIQKELQEIKGLLRARPAGPAAAAAPQNVTVDLDGAPVKGAKTAKVTMVEFTDYQ
jgi:protein-disulfide isomerase